MKTWQKIFFVTATTAMLTILAVTTANAAFVDNALNSVIEWISDKIWDLSSTLCKQSEVPSAFYAAKAA